MYGVDIARCNSSFPKGRETFDKVYPLLKEVLGYNDHEIKGFDHWLFYPPLALNLTKEEVRLIIQPFWDNDISVWAFELNEETGKYIMPNNETGYLTCKKFFGVVSQPPQDHYYDTPVVTRDKLIDPWNPPTIHSEWIHPNLKSKIQVQSANVPTCPTCGSTNIRRISTAEKATGVILFGIFSNKRKYQFECQNPKCKYKW